jgi:hypothetical protein
METLNACNASHFAPSVNLRSMEPKCSYEIFCGGIVSLRDSFSWLLCLAFGKQVEKLSVGKAKSYWTNDTTASISSKQDKCNR